MLIYKYVFTVKVSIFMFYQIWQSKFFSKSYNSYLQIQHNSIDSCLDLAIIPEQQRVPESSFEKSLVFA
ncbi:hypothetical protein pb186bvf_003002 [Paramecium bursaria]